jgi:hypothetical protein
MRNKPMSTRDIVCRWLATPWLFCGLAAVLALSIGRLWAGDDQKVPLKPNATNNAFEFETDQIQGTIRLDGPYHGVTRLIHKPTGRQLIDPRYSALNLFKLMAVNQHMGQPRTMERTTKVATHAVEATWPATPTHKAQITARYEVIEPNAVDVTVTVRSHGSYPGYEVFMPNYFDKSLRPYVFLQPARGSKEPELVLPTMNDVFRGMLLVFPRDVHAARRSIDGRWDRDEGDAPTVPQCPVRRYGHCLAVLAAPDQRVAAVLMAHPRQCYAFSVRYHAEDEADRMTPYSAFDFSLFGDDLLPGDERTATVRLALTTLDDEMSQPLKLYRAFLAETEPARASP